MPEYPVVITGTTKYVVWVDAEDAKQAHEFVQQCEYDYVERENPVEGWLDGETDPDETARYVWMTERDCMPQHDAHVHTHRWATLTITEDVAF